MCIIFFLGGFYFQSLTIEKLGAFLEVVKKITGGGHQAVHYALKCAKEGITIIAVQKSTGDVVGYVINTIKVSFFLYFLDIFISNLIFRTYPRWSLYIPPSHFQVLVSMDYNYNVQEFFPSSEGGGLELVCAMQLSGWDDACLMEAMHKLPYRKMLDQSCLFLVACSPTLILRLLANWRRICRLKSSLCLDETQEVLLFLFIFLPFKWQLYKKNLKNLSFFLLKDYYVPEVDFILKVLIYFLYICICFK